MHGAGKDGAKADPQKDHGTPEGALQGTEDGAKACDIQQLNQEELPLGKHHVVNAIVDGDSRSFTVVGSEDVFHQFAIGEITDDQKGQAQKETDHKKRNLPNAKLP